MPQPARKLPAKPRRGRIIWITVASLLLLAGAWWWFGRSHDGGAAFRTSTIDRGTIAVTISSTGSLSAISTVDIGAQVSGQVQSVLVDYNDHVTKGEVIARIDPSNLSAKVQQSTGAVAAARGQLAQAQATLKNAEADFARKSDLGKRQLIAMSDVDLARAARDQAIGAVAAAQAQVASQQAALDSAQLDLSHSVITSPVDGVVLTRAVEPGQTVAASLQTPTLFQIAEDLKQMQIILAVDEADIGQLKVGQRVNFNVDAFPDRQFNGVIKQVRLAATNTQNVITYPVVATVDNDDESLLPGMTVNAEIQISHRDNVLRVPNAALRFRPANAPADANAAPQGRGAGGMFTDEIPGIAAALHLDATQQAAFDKAMAAVRERAQEQRAKRASTQSAQPPASTLFGGGRGRSGGNGSGQGGEGGGAQMAQRMLARINQQFAEFRTTLRPDQQQAWDAALQALGAQKRATVWKLVDGKPQETSIRIGASDGSFTEVVGGALAEGDKVIVGVAAPDATRQ